MIPERIYSLAESYEKMAGANKALFYLDSREERGLKHAINSYGKFDGSFPFRSLDEVYAELSHILKRFRFLIASADNNGLVVTFCRMSFDDSATPFAIRNYKVFIEKVELDSEHVFGANVKIKHVDPGVA